MKKRLTVGGVALATLAASFLLFTHPAQAAVGIHVSGTNVVETNGSNFVMRGTSHAHVWYPTQTSSFANIKKLGANTVRVVLSGGRWGTSSASDVANVVSLCKANRLICVLEDHDTTGYGEDGAAYTLAQAVSYWTSLKSVLQGQESYIVINIGNEPYGNNNAANWTTDTSNAIKSMRSAGFEHMLMVDAPNWGQDWQFVMRDTAATVAAADPNKNTVFSIHMYEIFNSSSVVSSYVSAFKSKGLPLVIGEFGNVHGGNFVDADSIMSTAQSQAIGYLGWSWSGNGGSDVVLDQVTNFDPTQITSWGTRLFNGTNGIKSTAKEASIFNGQTTSPTTSSASPSKSASASASSSSGGGGTKSCTATYSVTGQWSGGFQGDVKVTAGSSAITGWTVSWTFANGQTVTQAWNATVTSSGSSVTAKNVSYNGSLGSGASTNFGFIGSSSSTNSVPSVACTAS